MWWQNSDPQSQISSTSFALTSPNARDFFKVESLHAKIALLEKQDFKREAYFAKRLAKSHSAKQELQDQLTRALAKADQFEKREKQIDAERTEAMNTAICAKSDANKIRQKHVTEFKQMCSLIANLKQQLHEREKDHCVRVSSHQSTHHKMKTQLAQLVAKQAELTAMLAAKTVAHEQSVKVHHEVIARCEAKLAERTIEIIEFKKFSRDAEIKTAQSRNDQEQLVEQQVLAIAEMQSIIATLQQSVAERDATNLRHQSCFSEQANRIVELENAHSESEKRNALLTEKQTSLTGELEAAIARLSQSVAERDATNLRHQNCFSEQADRIVELENAHSESEKRNALLTEKQTSLTGELEAAIARLQQSVAERDATNLRHQSCFSEQANRIVELENAHSESETRNALLTEKQTSLTAELEAAISTLSQSVAERDATIYLLEAKSAELTNKIVELEEFRRDAEFRYSQSQDSCNRTRRENAFLSEQQARATTKLKETMAAYEESIRTANRVNDIVEAQKQQLAHFQISLDESLQAMKAAKIAQMSAESHVHRCEEAVSELQEKTTQLQYRLQREAAGRRKAEAAMKQVSGSPHGESASRIVAVQFETEQRLDQLTKELQATRGLCRILQSRVNSKVEQGPNEKPSNQPLGALPRRAG